MSQNRYRTSNSGMVSASEIASWAYCPEQWRYQHLGNAPENADALRRGEAFHAKTVVVETSSRHAIRVGRVLVVLGLVLGLIAFWYGR